MPLSERKASAPKKLKPLWRCPDCGHRFVNKNTWHSCGTNTLKALFSRSDPTVFQLFKKFSKMVQACGPGKMITQQTRVVFQVRTRFAGCYPRKSHMDCAVALPRKIESPRFYRVDSYSKHFISHHLKVDSADQLDHEVQDWLRESYRVGAQEDFGE